MALHGDDLVEGPSRNYLTAKRGGGGKTFALREIREAPRSHERKVLLKLSALREAFFFGFPSTHHS